MNWGCSWPARVTRRLRLVAGALLLRHAGRRPAGCRCSAPPSVRRSAAARNPAPLVHLLWTSAEEISYISCCLFRVSLIWVLIWIDVVVLIQSRFGPLHLASIWKIVGIDLGTGGNLVDFGLGIGGQMRLLLCFVCGRNSKYIYI